MVTKNNTTFQVMTVILSFPTLTHTPSHHCTISFLTLTHTTPLPLYLSLSLSSLLPSPPHTPILLNVSLSLSSLFSSPSPHWHTLPYSSPCLSSPSSTLTLSFPTLTHTYPCPLPCTPSIGAGDVHVASDFPGRHDVGITLFVSHCITCYIYTHHVSGPGATATAFAALQDTKEYFIIKLKTDSERRRITGKYCNDIGKAAIASFQAKVRAVNDKP